MGQTETILERTDRMLSVITGKKPENAVEKNRARDITTLWNSGLGSSLIFSVDDPPADAAAEREALNIIARHLVRQKHLPSATAMSDMVEFQHSLQTRAKVLSAVEMLLKG